MVEFRLLEEKDLEAIRLLEQEIFSDPWSEHALFDWFSSDFSIGCIAQEDGSLLCYAIGNLIAGEAELFRIGCAPLKRKRGYGDATLKHFLAEAERKGAERIFLEVREHNFAARSLYEKNAFSLVGKRSLYYKNPDEDAFLYQKTIQAKGMTK